MTHPNLSFEQAPPISVPFRFFLTAPLFGIVAGLLLFAQGGDMFASRWMPATLAATHLLVAGFMLQAMCGALLQFVPVAAGGNIWRPRLVAAFVHPGLVLAAALLVTGFLTQAAGFFIAAVWCFGSVIALFLLVVGSALWRTPARGATIAALRIAIVGLLVTAVLGITLALGLARPDAPPPLALVDVHLAWGLGGWALTLLAGVSYFVVPMFQLTPAYPAWLARGLPFFMLAVVLFWSGQLLGYADVVRDSLLLAGVAGAGGFAFATLRLQSRRRRRVSDVTLLFFRTAMLCLLGLLATVAVCLALPALWHDPRVAVWLGTLTLVGVFVSVIGGMLYKIVPFLLWLHLQNLAGLHAQPPTMNQVIAERAMRRQFQVHLAALALLLATVWAPVLARPAGLVFALDCAWLGVNLVGAVRVYLRFKDRIRAAA